MKPASMKSGYRPFAYTPALRREWGWQGARRLRPRDPANGRRMDALRRAGATPQACFLQKEKWTAPRLRCWTPSERLACRKPRSPLRSLPKQGWALRCFDAYRLASLESLKPSLQARVQSLPALRPRHARSQASARGSGRPLPGSPLQGRSEALATAAPKAGIGQLIHRPVSVKYVLESVLRAFLRALKA